MRIVSNLAAQLSGSLGGVVATTSASGIHIRARAARVQPRSASATGSAALLGGISSAWRTLSAEQRAGWVNLAAAHSGEGRGGGASALSGFALFIRCNRNRITLGAGGLLLAAPAPPTVQRATDFGVFLILSQPSPPNYPIELVATFDYQTSAPSGFVLWASPPYPNGPVRCKQSRLRILMAYLSGIDDSRQILNAYQARFGPIPTLCSMTFGLQLIDPLSGFVSPIQLTTVAAGFQPAPVPPGGDVTIEINSVPVAQTSGVSYEVGGVPVASGS